VSTPMYTAVMLDVQHKKVNVGRQVRLLCPWAKALNGIPSAFI